MPFESLNHILSGWQEQPEFQEFQEFQRLLVCWREVVKPALHSHTRPVSVSRGILSVATSSSALVQDLMFQRSQILKALNACLSNPLTDIRFSTAQWQPHSTTAKKSEERKESVLISEHPSFVTPPLSLPAQSQIADSNDPAIVFQAWAEKVKARSQHLPLCPQCQSPTPTGELQRWGICAICATQGFKFH